MKRTSLLALVASLGIAGTTALPAHAADHADILNQLQPEGYTVKTISVNDLEQLKSELTLLGCDLNHITLPDCPLFTPDYKPEFPDNGDPTPDNTPELPGSGNSTPDNTPDQPESTPDNAPSETTFAARVAELVNIERAKAGLAPLTFDAEISSAALIRSKEIETSFSHTRPNGSSFSTVLRENGIAFRGAGENIAWGQFSPEEVMNGWMNSEGHRANILNPNYTKIGVGHYQNAAGRNFWTQLFTY